MTKRITDPTLWRGDCLEVLKRLPAESVQCCITSPPYWGLRDYGVDGQIGLEESPERYVARLVEAFDEVRRVLTGDGTLWLNLGDCYATGGGKVGECPGGGPQGERWAGRGMNTKQPKWAKALGPINQPNRMPIAGLKPKDLVGIPWRVAFALQAAGWWLRSDIIWSKPNVMPESVRDRPTRAHEYLFLLSKSERYYYDADAIKEPCASGPSDLKKMREGKVRLGGKSIGHENKFCQASARTRVGTLRSVGNADGRNKRSVWQVCSHGYSGAHFATFPTKLIEPCVLAGSRPGDVVLDPFNGAGTTGVVAVTHGRRYIGIELNPEYLKLSKARIASAQKLLTQAA